jgi:YVTN family beta-propeller protein
LSLLAALIAVVVLLPQMAQAHATVDAIKHADWRWLPAIVAASALSYLMAAIALLAASGQQLKLGRTWIVQVASAFTNRVLPAGLGGMATNVRYLEAEGSTRPAAVAAVAATSAAGFLVHVIGILAIAPLLRANRVHLRFWGPDLPDRWPDLLVVIVALTGAGLLRWGDTYISASMRRGKTQRGRCCEPYAIRLRRVCSYSAAPARPSPTRSRSLSRASPTTSALAFRSSSRFTSASPPSRPSHPHPVDLAQSKRPWLQDSPPPARKQVPQSARYSPTASSPTGSPSCRALSRIDRSATNRPTTSTRVAVVLGAALLLAACGSSNRASRTTPNLSTRPPSSHTTTSTVAPAKPLNVYGATAAGRLNATARQARSLVYVPESMSDYVDVIDPTTFRVIDRYRTGARPQHVVPAWDMRTLYAANNLGSSLTPIDPNTGKIAGPNIPVDDPYNLYFTPDGHSAIVVAEYLQRLDFRDPHTFAVQQHVPVDCAGIDHVDFSADGTYLIATCEYAGRLVKIDVATRTIIGYLDLPGSSPQDIKLEPAGHIFYVADMKLGGVHLIDGATLRAVGFIPTGPDAHGLYPSRDARHLYVSNRRGASISVIDFATRTVTATWNLPGTSPDMGGVSADGKVLWLSGRYNAAVYAISTVDGHLIATIPVPNRPHGLSVWPQPGRYSIGHTGITR